MNRMNVVYMVMALFFVFAASGAHDAAFANDQGGFRGPGKAKGGGFTGPGPEVLTARQAATMRDDSRVFMRGSIVQKLAEDKYLFRDASGTIIMDIDDGDWNGQTVSPEDTVEIYGKVDKDRESVEIEVKRLLKK